MVGGTFKTGRRRAVTILVWRRVSPTVRVSRRAGRPRSETRAFTIFFCRPGVFRQTRRERKNETRENDRTTGTTENASAGGGSIFNHARGRRRGRVRRVRRDLRARRLSAERLLRFERETGEKTFVFLASFNARVIDVLPACNCVTMYLRFRDGYFK